MPARKHGAYFLIPIHPGLALVLQLKLVKNIVGEEMKWLLNSEFQYPFHCHTSNKAKQHCRQDNHS